MGATYGGANRPLVNIEGVNGGIPQVHDEAMAVEGYWQMVLHEGELYRYNHADTDFDTGDGAKVFLLKIGGLDEYLHAIVEAAGTQATTVAIYETPRATALGTPQAFVNADRTTGGVPVGATLYLTPTTTANGTLLETFLFGANTGASKFGGLGGSGEWLLKADTDYLIVCTTLADNNVFSLNLRIALHSDGTAPTTTTTTT